MGIPFPIPTVRTKSQILAIWLHMNVLAAERLRLIGSCFATIKTQEDHTMARPKKAESIRRTNLLTSVNSLNKKIIKNLLLGAVEHPATLISRQHSLSAENHRNGSSETINRHQEMAGNAEIQ